MYKAYINVYVNRSTMINTLKEKFLKRNYDNNDNYCFEINKNSRNNIGHRICNYRFKINKITPKELIILEITKKKTKLRGL
jgi:hypothetical protein